MTQQFYPCSNCLDQFTSRELILVEVISTHEGPKHWVVCEECLAHLDDLGILVQDRQINYELS